MATCDSFDKSPLSGRLGRPPWHPASTAEIAAAAGIPFGRLSNWITRGAFPPPLPRMLFRVDGNKRLYRIDRVEEWLSGVSPEQQARQYLESLNLQAGGGDIWEHVRLLEQLSLFPHRWPPNASTKPLP